MKQIQFRAKVKYPENYHGKRDIAEGEWVSGDLHLRCRFPHIHIDIFNSYPIDVDTVGQFTGLYDKNGKEIYEGDIIRSYGSKGDEIKHTVYYSDKQAMFCTKLIGADMLGGSITQRWISEFEFEVIGNVHDNPQLLKGGEK